MITTLYGTLFANLVLLPISQRLRERHNQEMLCKEIVAQGVVAIQAGDNPRIIEQRLLVYLNEAERNTKSSKKAKASSHKKNKGGVKFEA